MLEVVDLKVEYPDKTVAVHDVSFSIEEGEHVALIGANGAGKSSIILAIMGIIRSEGKIIVDNITLNKNNVEEIRKKVGMLFQNPDDQLFMPTIYDDISFGPRNMGLDEETVKYRVNDRLRMLGIEHLKDRTALKLSGGEKRMAALATVLAMKPSVMLLDEPTAYLDPKSRRNLINVLNSLPHTIMIATHDLTFARDVCKRAIIIKDGKLFTTGECEKILYDKELMDNGGIEAIN